MRELLALVVVGVLAVSGCSRDDGPQTSNVAVHVADMAGVAAPGVVVVAQRRISDSQFEQINEAQTDGNGNVSLALPENATVMFGLWKDQPNVPAKYTWQTPIIVPVDDASLAYSYPVVTSRCPVVQPGPTPCPIPPTPPEPTASE